MITRRTISRLACALGLLATAASAAAQGPYPDHAVKLIVALPAGGGVDIIARLVGQKMAAVTGQPFVVDNRAGASGRIGLPAVAKAAPDGYTLMVSPASFLTTNKSIFKDLPYDPQADFAPITKCAGSPGFWPGVESADTVGVLMRGLLLFDVLAQDVNRRPPAA
ncbi:MAG: tripartite tricarboxylate transporter substrate-binding protein [Comamonas sp.]